MLKKFFGQLRRDERGVSALEYAILAAVIVGVLVTFFSTGEGGLKGVFDALFAKVTGSVDGFTGPGSDSGTTP